MRNRFIALLCFLLATASLFSEEDEPREDLFLSTPEQVASLSSEPSYLVGGLISPLSGQPVLRQTDLIVKGAQNIVLNRVYIPPHIPSSFPKHKYSQEEFDKRYLYYHLRGNYKGWQFYPHLRLELNPNTKEARLSEPSGMTLDFRFGPNYSAATLSSPPYAISNTAGDKPGGQYDPRNTRISYEENGDKITVCSAEGFVRIYRTNGWATKTSILFLLDKEILPNGKILRYHYNQGRPTRVESLDPKERYLYASIDISGSPWEGGCHFNPSSGGIVDYHFQTRTIHWKLNEKIKKVKHKEEINTPAPPLLVSVSSPYFRKESIEYYDNEFLMKTYSGKEDIFSVINGEYGDGAKHYRVHKVLLPASSNDAFTTVYELSYQPPVAGQKEGTTTVKNSDGTSQIYHFSKNLLTTSIQYFGANGEFKKEKVFSWDESHRLKSIEVKDAHRNLLYRKSYEYDRFGNPIVESFTGDLTGEGNQDTFVIKRKFSEDGKHLLLQEESDDGKVICFTYLLNTNLVTSKLTKDCKRTILREFFIYDDCHNLIEKTFDDGASDEKDDLSNVTQRTVTTLTLRQSAPFLHMPEWIEEKYWESGTEKPLNKTHLNYDQYGNVAQEEIFDAEGRYAYTIRKTYNERGDLLSETNRLGQEAAYTYDSRGRPETSVNFSKRLHKLFRRDIKGRLKELIETGDNGIVHVTAYEYDPQSRPVYKKDHFHNSTYYTYDPLVNEIAKTDSPPIESFDNQAAAVVTLSTYDSFGRQLTKTDPSGNVATYRYNAYGSPIEILHPNGGRESFRYTKNGKLASHTDLDGITIDYKHDILGRALSKTYISAEGETLAEETFTYNGFNLLTETDKENNVEQYFYDGAGRKIREDDCGHITDFSYDSLGRLSYVCKYNKENTLLTHFKRDLEAQILEEVKTDISGIPLYKISYTYDVDGNQNTITRYIDGKEAIDTLTYDPFQRLVEEKDAEGYVTTTLYDETYTNTLGQKVLQVTKVDPNQIKTIETHDAHSRISKKEILDPREITLSSQELIYDPCGNLHFRKDHIYENGRLLNTQIIKYTYTPDHRIASITRAYGTQDARTTAYTYFPSGKIASKTLPDNIALYYQYHPLGFMKRLDSSDGKIHHYFECDLLGHLTYALDENQTLFIEREVDHFGNILQETLSSNIEITKQYDDFNRLTSLKLGPYGEITYTYDPLYMRKVERISPQGQILYTHTYNAYDENGDLLLEDLIGNLGQVSYSHYPRGQKASISSPYFTQECHYDPLGNLISSIIDKTEQKYTYDGLSQLTFESALNTLYAYDSLHNRTRKNAEKYKVNHLNELSSLSYDLNGNQILKKKPSETFHFTYDPLGRLTEAVSDQRKIYFLYDPLGRCTSKIVHQQTFWGWKETSHEEHYIYHGQNEIGAVTSSRELKNLKIPGLIKHKDNPTPIGIEIEGWPYAPILDVQGNIRRLIDLKKAIASSYDFTAFGEELSSNSQLNNPWRFASKRFDPELALINFGKRFYDPELGGWLTTDPAWFIDSSNLYQYVFNNPFRYTDPDGKFVFVIPLLSLTWKLVAVAVATALVSYELEHLHKHSNSSFERNFNSAAHQVVQNIGGVSQYLLNQKLDTGKKKQVDERLPKDPDELLNDSSWEETSHPNAKEKGHRTFENKETGEKVRYDAGKLGTTGHKAQDHWHRYNPDSTGDIDIYLDAKGNPVPDGHPDSHLYPR